MSPPNCQEVTKDVTIVVGDKEFMHSSSLLRYASEYFDAMFSHDLKERNEMRVEFPEENPSDWVLVSKFLESGVAQPDLSTDNVHVLLPWFERLMMKSDSLKIACDNVYPNVILSEGSVHMGCIYYSKPTEFDECIRSFRLACRFDLPKTKRESVRVLRLRAGSRLTLLVLAGLNAEGVVGEVELFTLFLNACCEEDRLRDLCAAESAPSFSELVAWNLVNEDRKKCPECKQVHVCCEISDDKPAPVVSFSTPDDMSLSTLQETGEDVTIVVDDIDFRHSSTLLRYASKYFDALFSHQMKETSELRVEFREENLSEWVLVSTFLKPGVAQPAITTDNAHVLLPWFDRLMMRSDSLKSKCDDVFPSTFRTKKSEAGGNNRGFYHSSATDIDECILAFALGCRFDLPNTKRESIRSLRLRVGSRTTLIVMAGLNAEGIVGEVELSRLFLNATCEKDHLRVLYTATSVPSFTELVAADAANKHRVKCDVCDQHHGVLYAISENDHPRDGGEREKDHPRDEGERHHASRWRRCFACVWPNAIVNWVMGVIFGRKKVST